MDLDITHAPLPERGTLVLPVGHDGTLGPLGQALDERAKGLVGRALALDPTPRKHGATIELPLPAGLAYDRLVLLVAGKAGTTSPLEVEELGGTIVSKLRIARVAEAAVAPADGLGLGLEGDALARALATGALLRAYRFTKYRAAPGDDEPPTGPTRLTFHIGGPAAEPAPADAARALGASVALARDLVSEPANVLYPEAFAAACRELEPLGVQVEVLDRDKLEQLGMRALLGVAQGSARPPFVVVMRWRGATQPQPLALIGKGVCFDTGGISIKPAGGMEEMKSDMAGAAAVVGAMKALAGRKAKADVVGVIGLVENMPSGTAQRPGDVVKAMSGKTIEVINTDAEGRLVLADVVWYAKETFKPKAMIDLATLTGAVVVALGHERAGLFATDEELAAKLTAAGEAVGERLWRLPLGKDYSKHIKSEIADIKNVGRARQAGASAGAVFIQEFVGDVPWAHLDIAGTAWSGKDLPLAPKGATGFGVRLLDRLVADAFEEP